MLIIEQIYVRRSFFGGGGILERERERKIRSAKRTTTSSHARFDATK
jgi:hypothetical protein